MVSDLPLLTQPTELSIVFSLPVLLKRGNQRLLWWRLATSQYQTTTRLCSTEFIFKTYLPRALPSSQMQILYLTWYTLEVSQQSCFRDPVPVELPIKLAKSNKNFKIGNTTLPHFCYSTFSYRAVHLTLPRDTNSTLLFSLPDATKIR